MDTRFGGWRVAGDGRQLRLEGNDAAVKDGQQARAGFAAARQEAEAQLQAKQAELVALERVLGEAEASGARTYAALEEAKAAGLACDASLDEATAMNQGLRKELFKLGKDVDQLLSVRGVLASSLEQARARLDELREAQAAAERRAALFRC